MNGPENGRSKIKKSKRRTLLTFLDRLISSHWTVHFGIPIGQKPITKCEELIKWIGDFLPEANRDMVSTRLRALMNHDEIQETSTGHVVVSREFRAKIRSKSVPGTL